MSIEKDFKRGKWAEDVFQEFYTRTHQGAKAERLELKAYADFFCEDESYGLTDVKESEVTFSQNGYSLNLLIEKYSTLKDWKNPASSSTEGWIDHKVSFRGNLRYPQTFFFIQPVNGISGRGKADKPNKYPVTCERATEKEFKRFQQACKAWREQHPEDTRENRFIYETPFGICFKINRDELLKLIDGLKVEAIKKYEEGKLIGYSGCYKLPIEKISEYAAKNKSTISVFNLVRYKTIDAADGIAIRETKTAKYCIPARLQQIYKNSQRAIVRINREKNTDDDDRNIIKFIIRIKVPKNKAEETKRYPVKRSQIRKIKTIIGTANKGQKLEMLKRVNARQDSMDYIGLITMTADAASITTLEELEGSVRTLD